MLMPGLVLLGSHAANWAGRRRRGGHRESGPSAATHPGIVLPADIDAGSLVDALRQQFIRLQAAWDAADRGTLGQLTTPQMLEEICAQFPPEGSPPNRTDVVSLQARLLSFEDLHSAWLATIEFSGMIREAPDRGAVPFREVWLLTRERVLPFDRPCGGPWRLARQQALL